LKAEPLALYVPDTNDRYYCIQFIDAYSNSFQYVGRRVTGTREGRYLIAGPAWEGHVPAGHGLIEAPTKRVLALARTLVGTRLVLRLPLLRPPHAAAKSMAQIAHVGVFLS
jgi:hypothetical protein